MTEQPTSSKPWYKKWWAITLFIFFGLIVISSLADNDNSTNQTNIPAPKKQEEQSNIEIPQYRVLDKTEHISTRMSDTEASYFGGVLIEEDVTDIPPEEFIEIAQQIADKEGLDYDAHFYSTEEAFRADYSVYVPEENKESLEQLGGLESNQEYMPQSEIDRLLSKGYIGNFEDGEFIMSPSSAYYERHHAENNEEQPQAESNERKDNEAETIPTSDEENINRTKIAEKLNQIAENRSANVTFTVDSNDDTTLIINRNTNLKPAEVQNWENYLYGVSSSPEKLKTSGFNKVRIYTNASEGIADYDLKIL